MNKPVHISEMKNSETEDFIAAHLNDNPADLILHASKYPSISMKFAAAQIDSRRRTKTKLPEWAANPKLIFPPAGNLEQASSEITAKFKSRQIEGESLADLTGGSGVDTMYLSRNFRETVYVEPDEALFKLSAHNFGVLGGNISLVNSTAEAFLQKNHRKFDWIYLDPSRREGNGKRISGLEDSHPNILEMTEALFEASDRILVKASPLINLKQTLKSLKYAAKVQVVAVDNEVKEILFYLKKGFEGEIEIEAHNLSVKSGKEAIFAFTFEEESRAVADYSLPLHYIYEPNAALMKAGPYRLLAEHFGLKKLAPSTHLYTSDVVLEDFPGKVYEVIEMFKPKKKEISIRFKKGIVNVLVRNYPVSTNELKKSFKLKDGGGETLLFSTLNDGTHKAMHLRKLVL